MGEPVTLGVMTDFEDPGSEFRLFPDGPKQTCQRGHKFVDSIEPKTGAEEAGEYLPACRKLLPQRLRNRVAVEIGVHCRLSAEGQLLVQLGILQGEIHTAVAEVLFQPLEQIRPRVPGQIHLGDKQECGDLVVLQKLPEGPGVGLHPVDTADDQDRVIQNLQDPLCLRGEIHVTRGVQQGQLPVGKGKMGLTGKNRNAPFPLQRVEIHGGVAVIHPAGTPQQTAPVEHCLRQGGFACVHMGQ